MGYTHYWYRKPEMDEDVFKLWSDDVRKLVAAARQGGIVIVDGLAETPDPEITKDVVAFNGQPDHETFMVERTGGRVRDGEVFGFCKTAQKPYDMVVVAALIALKARFGDAVKVSSDGDRADWEPGIALADKVLGTGGSWDFPEKHLEYTEV